VEGRTRLLRERDTGSAIDPSRQTFAEYVRDEWLPSREPVTGRAGRGHRGKVGVQTWDAYCGDLERNVIPRIGDIALQKLTPSDLNRLYDELEQSGGQTGTGLSPKTIANIHGVVHKARGDAVKLGKVSRNVADAV
jgi:integrase